MKEMVKQSSGYTLRSRNVPISPSPLKRKRRISGSGSDSDSVGVKASKKKNAVVPSSSSSTHKKAWVRQRPPLKFDSERKAVFSPSLNKMVPLSEIFRYRGPGVPVPERDYKEVLKSDGHRVYHELFAPKPPKRNVWQPVPRTAKELALLSKPHAFRALRFLNKNSETKYDVVDYGVTATRSIWAGLGHHTNFCIKEKGKPHAPVLMVFVEFFEYFPKAPRVDILEILGPKESLPATTTNNQDCKFCRPDTIHHPAITGWFGKNWSVERYRANHNLGKDDDV